VIADEVASMARLPPPPSAVAVQQSTASRLAACGRYFADKLGLRAEPKIDSVQKLAGGFSNETFLVTVTDSGRPLPLVIRRSNPAGLVAPYGASLIEEFSFLELLHRAGARVAKPLWIETDATIIGGVFVASEFVDGKTKGLLEANREIGDELWRDLARQIAHLHSIDWRPYAHQLPTRFRLAPEMGVAHSIASSLERLRQYWAQSTLAPSPLITFLYTWLIENEPVESSVVITHGDLGFHNILCKNDRVMAIVDWETVTLCSPVQDLEMLRNVKVPAEVWPRFLEWYVEAGGIRPDPAEFDYFAMFRAAKSALCTAIAMEKMFPWADPLNIKYLELGIPGRQSFYQQAQKEIETQLRRMSVSKISQNAHRSRGDAHVG
jgi:aminoglycoside phosphotransferase (APT) family kinase protein